MTDSEKYEEIPDNVNVSRANSKDSPTLARGTTSGTKKSTATSKWGGYGWGLGKKDKMAAADLKRGQSERTQVSFTSETNLPAYEPPTRSNTRTTTNSRSTTVTRTTQKSRTSNQTRSMQRNQSHRSNRSAESSDTILRRPPLRPNDSSDTLVGSALNRKINAEDGSGYENVDTAERLEIVREHMEKEKLDY